MLDTTKWVQRTQITVETGCWLYATKSKKHPLVSKGSDMPDDKKQSLPKFQEAPDYVKKIKAAQKPFLKHTITQLATEFFHEKDVKKKIEARLSESNLKLAALEGLLLKGFEDDELSMIRLEGSDASIFKKSTAYPVVKDKKALFAWIKANKAVHLVGIVHQSLKAFVNERLENGEKLPVGVDVFLKDSIGHRGGGSLEHN